MIDSRVSQSLVIQDRDEGGRKIHVDLPMDRDDLTLTMTQGKAGEDGYQHIYYILTRRQALILGKFFSDYGTGTSAVDAGRDGDK